MGPLAGPAITFSAIDFPSAAVGYVADTTGRVHRTQDHGRTWVEVLRIGASWPPTTLSFSDPLTGLVGSRGGLYRTRDGGDTWEQITVSGEVSLWQSFPLVPHDEGESTYARVDHLIRVKMLSAQRAVATGISGTLLTTVDDGDTWSRIASRTTSGLRAVGAPTTDDVYIGADDGMVLAYAFGHDAARVLRNAAPDPLPPVLEDCACPDRDTVLFVGSEGTVIRSVDRGQTWATSASGTEDWLTGVAFFSPSHGLAVGWRGTLLRTFDGGLTWVSEHVHSALRFSDVVVSSPSTAYIIGSPNVLLRSDDAGTTFRFVTSLQHVR